jgi:hypothetical protein
MVLSTPDDSIGVAAPYRFMDIADPEALRAPLLDLCSERA